jgi:hypothetical protein
VVLRLQLPKVVVSGPWAPNLSEEVVLSCLDLPYLAEAESDDMSLIGGKQDRERLAAHIDARQQELGVPWTQVIKESGLTKEGLRKIREGLSNPRAQTRRGLERALRWTLGSIDTVLAGGNPVPLSEGRQTTGALTTTEMAAEAHRAIDRLQELREELRRRVAAAEDDPDELERSVIALRIVQDIPDESGTD